MDYAKKLKDLVEKKYLELQEYSSIYSKKSTAQREKLMTEHKEAFMKNPDEIDIKAITRDMFYLNGFYQTDIRKMQAQLLELYTAVKDIDPTITFSKEVENTVVILKGSLPKQLFIVKDGEFHEIEKGKVESLKKDFEERNYHQFFEKQVMTILNA
jgi:hypothetical protein